MINCTCVIVDDEQDSIELLSNRIGRLYKSIQVVGKYNHWNSALDALRGDGCDLLFLDISMPEKSGFDLLKLLPNLTCEVIFVTAHDNYALEAFAFSVSGYVLKPIDDLDLSNAIDKALTRVAIRKKALQLSSPAVSAKKIGIPSASGIDYVDISDILYFESVNKCTRVVTTRNSYTSSYNLGKFLHLVETHSFFQVHRSYIVNLKHIQRYDSSQVVFMTNSDEIPVSRNVKGDLLDLFESGI